MAHVYFADKKKEHMLSTTSKGEIISQKKKSSQSWGNSLKPLVKIIEFVQKHRIYRPYRWVPWRVLNGWGHLFGMLSMGRSRSVRRKIKMSFEAIFPNQLSPKRLKRLVDATCKYFGVVFLDMMFRVPLTADLSVDHFYEYINLKRIDDALKEGKGVIVPTLHLGMFFHTMGSIFQHPNKYQSGGIAAISNLKLYALNNRKRFDNLHIFASTNYSKISRHLENHLKQNRILVVTHDYSSKRHLRTPFIKDKYPYLIHTPQSYIRLHKKTGAPIVPLVGVPKDKVLGKTRLEFLDNSRIKEISKKYWDAPDKEFHGRLSTEINQILFPYCQKYLHIWEEINNFATVRIEDSLKFEAGCSVFNFLSQIKEKMLGIIEGSFEPDRKDDEIINLIELYFPKILGALKNPSNVLRNHKTKINLSRMSSIEEMVKLCKVSMLELKKYDELEVIAIFREFLSKNEWSDCKNSTEFKKYKETYYQLYSETKFDTSLTEKVWGYYCKYVRDNWIVKKNWLQIHFKQFKDGMKSKMQSVMTILKSDANISYEKLKAKLKI
jgi:lauroyl/myristoyl acyltransferase